MSTRTPDRPLRRDAVRNRTRILDGARTLFAERGLGATLNDVAHHCGLGVGTVYRHFPDKATLVATLFEESFAQIVARMDAALADPDPWHGLVGFLEGQFEAQAADRGLQDLMTATPDALERIGRLRDEMLPRTQTLVARAQSAGTLRPDIAPPDLAIVQLMVGSVLYAAHDVDPELWRRYLWIVLRGLSTRPDELPVSTVAPLDPAQIAPVMTAGKRVRC